MNPKIDIQLFKLYLLLLALGTAIVAGLYEFGVYHSEVFSASSAVLSLGLPSIVITAVLAIIITHKKGRLFRPMDVSDKRMATWPLLVLVATFMISLAAFSYYISTTSKADTIPRYSSLGQYDPANPQQYINVDFVFLNADGMQSEYSVVKTERARKTRLLYKDRYTYDTTVYYVVPVMYKDNPDVVEAWLLWSMNYSDYMRLLYENSKQLVAPQNIRALAPVNIKEYPTYKNLIQKSSFYTPQTPIKAFYVMTTEPVKSSDYLWLVVGVYILAIAALFWTGKMFKNLFSYYNILK